MAELDDISAGLCLNCEAPLSGPFCGQCGQKVGPARVTLRGLFGQLIGETFELDGRVPRTLVPFLTRPGFLTLEYNAGRRKAYTAPLRLFLAMGALWVVLAFSLSQWRVFHPVEFQDDGAEVRVDDPDDPGGLVRAMGLAGTEVGELAQVRLDAFQALSNEERMKRVRKAASEIPPTVALVLFPVFAIFLKLVMLGSGRTLPEHAVFAIHAHAYGLLLLVLMRVLGDDEILLVGLVWFGGYVFLALRRAYELSWWGAIWRWSVLAMLFVTITSTVFVMAVLGTAITS